MSAQDYRINAEVRRYFVSRWVDVSRLQIGTTNGVIYILGHLETTMEDPRRRLEVSVEGGALERLLLLARQLERDLRRIRDVRDVIFKFENITKRGGKWRAANGAALGADTGRSSVYVLPSAPGPGVSFVEAVEEDDNSGTES
jgi:hypothetical protein